MHDDYNTLNPNIAIANRVSFPLIELNRMLDKYASVYQKRTNNYDMNQISTRNSFSHFLKETNLDKIDQEILVNNDLLITTIRLDPNECNYKNNKEKHVNLQTEIYPHDNDNLSKRISPKRKGTSKSYHASSSLKTPNASPRTTKNSSKNASFLIDLIGKPEVNDNDSALANNNNNKTHNSKLLSRTNIKSKNIDKFINKPKPKPIPIKKQKSFSNNKSTDTLLQSNQIKKAKIPISSIKPRSNDKIIADLQTMFGKQVENLDNMYPNLDENDKKNLINVLLTMTFNLNNELKEEKLKIENLSKELLNKTKQLNIAQKENATSKRPPSCNNQTPVRGKTFHCRATSQISPIKKRS